MNCVLADHENMLCVIFILLSLFMMLLKIIMREENMVVGIFMLLKHLSLYQKIRSCSCFIYPCLLICASLIYFLTRFLCIGSGVDLNVFHIFSLMLSFASIHISYVSILLNY
jgi:hypothetical protein